MSQTKICALFMFNHRFERNLPMIERLYGKRFSHRHILMPFATNPGPNISRVYELGRNFSGHIAQAARDFIREDFTHYVVIPDDLLLNPDINEKNIIERLNLREGEGYINNLIAADALRYSWPWAGEAAGTFGRSAQAIDLKGLLPPAEEAKVRFENMGIVFPSSPGPANFFKRIAAQPKAARTRWAYLYTLSLLGRKSPYPLLAGYSDFLVIPAAAIDRFAHYCGVMAALNIFAEIAVPTALALSTDRLKTELELNWHFVGSAAPRADPTGLKGVAFWKEEDFRPYAELLAKPLDEMIATFPEDVLYLHPVKLSNYA